MKMTFLSRFLMIGFLVLSTSLFATNYPPDYALDSVKKELGAITLQVGRGYYWANLKIYYNGFLPKDDLTVWIKINGRSGFFKMKQEGSYGIVTLGTGPRDCFYRTEWECDYPTEKEKEIFFWAQDQNGQTNNWQVELAFTSRFQWDSNNARNYKVDFNFAPINW